MEKRGIDISHHQGDINFSKLKGNIDFAMVRTSYGAFYKDNKYDRNIKGLESINVPYGLYHFSYATNVDSAKKEAEGFLNLIKNYRPLFPVVIDIEYSDRTSSVRSDTLSDIAKTFCSILEENGYYVMIYANLDYLNNKLNNKDLDKYDKWLAQWSSKPTYKKAFGIWQYSSKGSVPGITGNVDMNISYKDYPSIIKEKGLNKIGKGVIVKQEVKEVRNNNEINYVVKKGDTLSSIASKYNTTYQVLAKNNNIKDPNKIYIGQIIKINGVENNISPKTYVVKKGDTLSSIASKYNIKWQDLYNKNKSIIGSNPNKIYPGQILNI